MIIGIFYRDYLGDHGVPIDVQNYVNELSKFVSKVIVYTITDIISEEGTSIISDRVTVKKFFSSKKNSFRISKKFKEAIMKNSDDIDIMHIKGLALPENYSVAKLCKNNNIKYVVSTFSQVTKEFTKGKIFTIDPNVKKLYKPNQSSKFSIRNFKSRLQKEIFLGYYGKYIIENSTLIHALSKFEKEEIINRYSFYKGNIITEPWGFNDLNDPKYNIKSNDNVFLSFINQSENLINIIFWGRLDCYYKGLDLLVMGLHKAMIKVPTIKVRLFMVGPDYNNGKQELTQIIEKYNMNKHVFILDKKQYMGRLDILRDSSALIYPSRWDGFPRAIREATILGVPCIASKQSNAGDLIEEVGAGVCFDLNVESISKLFLELDNGEISLEELKSNIPKLYQRLTWMNIAQNMVEEFKKVI